MTLKIPQLKRYVNKIFNEVKRKIASEDIDLVILTARRAACLYLLWKSLDPSNRLDGKDPNKPVTIISSSAIDSLDKNNYENILIVDDTVIIGTTIVDLGIRIREIFSQGVRISAIAITQGKDALGFLTKSVYLETLIRSASSEELDSFSKGIVQYLYEQNFPLIFDFPVTALSHTSFSGFGSSKYDDSSDRGNWIKVNAIAPQYSELKVKSNTYFPRYNEERRLLGGLPQSVVDLVQVVKFRVFEHQDNGQVSWRIVPITLLRPALSTEIEIAVDSLSTLMCRNGLEQPWPRWIQPDSHTNNYALLQYLISEYTLFRALSFTSNFPIDEVHMDEGYQELRFGPATNTVKKISQVLVELAIKEHPPAPPSPLPVFQPPTSLFLLDKEIEKEFRKHQEFCAYTSIASSPQNTLVLGSLLPKIFATLFKRIAEVFEDDQKQELKDLKEFPAYEKWRCENSRYLNEGLSLDELSGLLKFQNNIYQWWACALTSLALDIGNDLGIVVPTLKQNQLRDQMLISRLYRYGETAKVLAGDTIDDMTDIEQLENDTFLRPEFCLENAPSEESPTLKELWDRISTIRDESDLGEIKQILEAEVRDEDGLTYIYKEGVFWAATKLESKELVGVTQESPILRVGLELDLVISEDATRIRVVPQRDALPAQAMATLLDILPGE